MLFRDLPIQPMDHFERMYYRRGYERIAGVDEVGRGPLAGPVVAAAVILPQKGIEQRLYDSKKISPKKREELYELILSKAPGVGIGIIGQEEIDLFNIFQATLKAMALAIQNLPIPPDFILIDGNQVIQIPLPQKPIRKGDQLSSSIAAASIVAKVTRDRMMVEWHQKYPHYNFARHKGYGTKEHREAIEKFGICEIHRKSFRGVREYLLRGGWEVGRQGGLTTDTDHGNRPRREKKELGKKGEEIAIRFLTKKGYRILLRNYVCQMGEMDIIAREKDTLVFIEVKTRTSTAFGPPQLAVNSAKQMQLSKVALYFLKEKKLEDVKARFDVVAVLLGQKGEEIELIRDAFDLKYI